MQLLQVDKKIRLDQWAITKFQLIVHCYLSGIRLSNHDLSCLALLSILGDQTLEDFCQKVVDKKIFTSAQSARNAISKAEKLGLISKEGKNRKKIFLNPTLSIQSNGNIVLNYKIVHLTKQPTLEPQES